MYERSIRLRSDLFWIFGSIEGAIDARKTILNEAEGLLAKFVEQDIAYLDRLRNKVDEIIKQIGVNVEDEP